MKSIVRSLLLFSCSAALWSCAPTDTSSHDLYNRPYFPYSYPYSHYGSPSYYGGYYGTSVFSGYPCSTWCRHNPKYDHYRHHDRWRKDHHKDRHRDHSKWRDKGNLMWVPRQPSQPGHVAPPGVRGDRSFKGVTSHRGAWQRFHGSSGPPAGKGR